MVQYNFQVESWNLTNKDNDGPFYIYIYIYIKGFLRLEMLSDHSYINLIRKLGKMTNHFLMELERFYQSTIFGGGGEFEENEMK